MGRNKTKKPKLKQEPGGKKRPAAQEHSKDEDKGRYPSWRVGHMECMDEFGAWHVLDQYHLLEVRSKLASFETMTWYEILTRDGDRNHPISVSAMVPSAAERLLQLKLDDHEQLISLRLTGTNRIFGIREGDSFRLLWWDPNHAICPSKLKNT